MINEITIATAVSVFLTSGCAVALDFDEVRYRRLIEHSMSYRHVAVSDAGLLRDMVVEEIAKIGSHDRVLVAYNTDFSLLVEKEGELGVWTPRAFLRIRMPNRTDFAEPREFLRACLDFHTSVWVLAHPTKPYYYSPAVPVSEVRKGIWGVETGPAVVSGDGLFVEVDASGTLVSVKEIFSPD